LLSRFALDGVPLKLQPPLAALVLPDCAVFGPKTRRWQLETAGGACTTCASLLKGQKCRLRERDCVLATERRSEHAGVAILTRNKRCSETVGCLSTLTQTVPLPSGHTLRAPAPSTQQDVTALEFLTKNRRRRRSTSRTRTRRGRREREGSTVWLPKRRSTFKGHAGKAAYLLPRSASAAAPYRSFGLLTNSPRQLCVERRLSPFSAHREPSCLVCTARGDLA